MAEHIGEEQYSDPDGNVVMNASKVTKVDGAGTFEVAAAGVKTIIIAMNIWSDFDGGTWYCTDGDDAEIPGLPFSNWTNKARTDWGGAWSFYRLQVANGFKIHVDAGATTFSATVFSYQVLG
jgi:hypothetical protein